MKHNSAREVIYTPSNEEKIQTCSEGTDMQSD
jgi:hypothetical protein